MAMPTSKHYTLNKPDGTAATAQDIATAYLNGKVVIKMPTTFNSESKYYEPYKWTFSPSLTDDGSVTYAYASIDNDYIEVGTPPGE